MSGVGPVDYVRSADARTVELQHAAIMKLEHENRMLRSKIECLLKAMTFLAKSFEEPDES